jgi:hypothetical protein
LKYSVIDWDTKSFANPKLAQLYRFLNSQVTGGYKFVPSWLNQTVTLYGAYLVNHKAIGVAQTNGELANKAWYTGFSIGKVRKKGDWSMDVSYQYVQAQAVPDYDVSGIGKGNAAGIGFYVIKPSDPNSDYTTIKNAFGRVNYQGINGELLYLFQDNITIYQSYCYSWNANSNIGPKTKFSQYEVEIIYAF